MASTIAGDRAAAAGLPRPEEVAHDPTVYDPTVCQSQIYLGHEALRQAHLSIREGGLGLTSSSSIKGAAYIGCHALALGCVVDTSFLERLPERPMASALVEELKTVATEAKISQIEDAERNMNSTGRRGSRRGRGVGVGAGVLDSENNGRIRW